MMGKDCGICGIRLGTQSEQLGPMFGKKGGLVVTIYEKTVCIVVEFGCPALPGMQWADLQWRAW